MNKSSRKSKISSRVVFYIVTYVILCAVAGSILYTVTGNNIMSPIGFIIGLITATTIRHCKQVADWLDSCTPIAGYIKPGVLKIVVFICGLVTLVAAIVIGIVVLA